MTRRPLDPSLNYDALVPGMIGVAAIICFVLGVVVGKLI